MSGETLTKRSLDDVMMAMDVVDTLRHRSRLVEKELGAEDRDEELKQKLRKIYAAQGIEVPDHVLEEGVKALRDGRFSYQAPAESLQVKLARIYVRRGSWGKWVFGGIATLILALASYYFLVMAPSTMLPEKVQKVHQEVRQAAKIEETRGRTMAEELFMAATAALDNGDEAKAKQLLGSMEALKVQLQAAYRLQIVVKPQAKTGVWRIPDANKNARNYYIIVEAVGPDGNLVKVPIKNEETGKTDIVSTWGLRVDEKVFNRIARDKQDDGIVQDRDFGVKQSGFLDPKYRIPTTGAAITSWQGRVMISGRKTLGTFEQALAEVRRKLEEVDKQTNELSNRQLALEQEDLSDYRQLARLRVDLLATEKAQSSLDEAEKLAKALLDKRQIERAALSEELAAAKKKNEEIALRRAERAAAVAALSDQIDKAEKTTQDRLDKDLGSGGFGRGTVWGGGMHSPRMPGPSGGGFRFPSGGDGSSGGGFRTGGGF